MFASPVATAHRTGALSLRRRAAGHRAAPVGYRLDQDGSHQERVVPGTGSRGDAGRWNIADVPVFPQARGTREPAAGYPLAPPRPSLPMDLALGDVHDPAERQAEHIAHQIMNAPRAVYVPPAPVPPPRTAGAAGHAPRIVHEVLRATGQPLDSGARSFFEPRLGVDLSRVRVHADTLAARSASAVGARAYTLGDHIVLGAGQYRPGTIEGQTLLAHELAHVTAPGISSIVRRQPVAAPQAPRKNYVFIMGADASPRNAFYKSAERYYRTHVPNAVFNTSLRSLEGLLNFLATSAKTPIADLYIVAHGSEDGTLAFSLEPNAKDRRLTVSQLRAALHPQTGTSKLTSVSAVIDENTRIHIKGCDIGRTQEMVELLSEAFGGAGTVTAPTHEQGFQADATLREQARRAEHDARIAAFTEGLPAVPPVPGPVDPALRGAERRTALQQQAEATRQRQAAISARAQALRAEEKRIAPEVEAAAARAGWVDRLSGPMFQRPGTQLFTMEELRPEVDRLYGHLSKDQRGKLLQQLVASDRRSGAQQQQQQLLGQEGQRVDRLRAFRQTFADPADLSEARKLFHAELTRNHFTADSMDVTRADGKNEFTFSGRAHPPGKAAYETTLTIRADEPDHGELIAKGREHVQNPDRFAWRIERTHNKNGLTTLTVVAERVVAYLWHGSLDVSQHDYFNKPETNRDFYATSTFQPTGP